MKQTIRWLGLMGAGTLLLAGCVSPPPPRPGPISSVKPLEVRTSVSFPEVMVAVPVEGAHQVYQNLHVGLAAVITPRKDSVSDPSQVEEIIRRLEPKVSAATLQVVSEGGTVSLHKLGALRLTIACKAQEVAKQTFAQWSHASEYEVEVMVVSMFFTDSTVGRTDPGRRWY